MVSSYSTDLKLELMVTGENAGLWGDITNTNLNILQQSIAGYSSIPLNATTGATLVFSNGLVSDGKNAVLNLTGTLTSSVNVIVPDSGSGTAPEKTYTVKNSTSGAYAVTFKTTSGTGATWSTTDKGTKLLYSDGTNVVDVLSNASQINLVNRNEVRFEDTTGGQYIGLKAPATISSSFSLSLPTADGTSGQAIVTDGAGALSFATAGISTGKAIAMAIVFG
jgi:hypothetical protein